MPEQSYRDGFFFRLCRCISKAPQKVKDHFGRALNKHQLDSALVVVGVPHAIETLFEQYSENGIMTVDHLHRFLIEIQEEENATKEDAQAIFYSLDDEEFKGLNQSAFSKYLFGDINPPLSPSRQVHHDMTAPSSHYFIYTGHNSYLTGNPPGSECSDVPIIQALQRGVRVIELDIWPNSKKDNVDVLHGRTQTTSVELIKCLRSIKEHAFSSSEYPVVVTLEDHLTSDLQAKVAEMVTQTFGDMLFCPGSECLKEFPSPESLKRRIIISTKPPKEYLEAKEGKEKESISREGKALGDEPWGKEVSVLKSGTVADDKNYLDEEEDSDEEDLDGGDVISPKTAAAPPEYKHLIAIHAWMPTGGLDECLKVDPDRVRHLSLTEKQLEKAVETHGKQTVRFTQRNILRVYPKGTHFESSNYNPLIGWTHGAQMVGFNMQGYGRSLWLMQGMFKANGGCGYLKKPDFLLKTGPHNQVFDPSVKLPLKRTLKVTLYMSTDRYYYFRHMHSDAADSPSDFYVRIGIAGVAADTTMQKSRALEDFFLSWREEFEFPLTVPELALLRIEVHEYYYKSNKDDFRGQTCLPVSELRKGIRAVPLHDREGEKSDFANLLMRFEFV